MKRSPELSAEEAACENRALAASAPGGRKVEMCGFIAIVSRRDCTPDLLALDASTDLLAHRGPDDRAVFTDGPFAVGFRRLSIFDLTDAARQPMSSRDGRHVIVFNGCIYNWPELRKELEARGHMFVSHGDTEVLLAAWREWGPDCLPRLNGMFAFLVWDRTEQRLWGARDRFGVKPLFWTDDGESLIFGSEIKALRRMSTAPGGNVVNREVMADFTVNGRLDASEETFFSGIRRVPAGTWFCADATGRVRWSTWWSLDAAVAARSPSTNPAEEFAETFEDAVRLRMRSDVKVGVLLSGGLDSTSIICAMSRTASGRSEAPHAFGFASTDPNHDESAAVTATISQTGAKFEQVVPSPTDLWNLLGQHLWHQDEPVYSMSSVVAEYLVMAARRAGVKVLLNGQGADEILAGYPSYFSVYWSELLRAGRFPTAIASVRAFAKSRPDVARQYAVTAVRDSLIRAARRIPGVGWLAAQRPRVLESKGWVVPELSHLARSPGSDHHLTLADSLRYSVERSDLPIYLRQEDRNAMAHGVEARLPFLDHRLVTLAFGLGAEWKLSGSSGKHLLRQAMRGRIPENVRTNVRKLGFPTPLDAWFRGPLYGPMRDLLAGRTFRECGIWQTDRVSHALELHREGRESCGTQLFDVAQTCFWLDTVVPSIRAK